MKRHPPQDHPREGAQVQDGSDSHYGSVRRQGKALTLFSCVLSDWNHTYGMTTEQNIEINEQLNKKRIGRPPAAGVTRSVRFELRVTPAEMQVLQTNAASEGVSLAEYMRRRLTLPTSA